jgi:hypothetical protein
MRKITAMVVTAKFEVEGFHNWPEAPDGLIFLRTQHRHMFHVEVAVEVTEVNRQVEIILLRKQAERVFKSLAKSLANGVGIDFGSRSCEMLASELGLILIEQDLAVAAVSVLEDGENGATVYFEQYSEISGGFIK